MSRLSFTLSFLSRTEFWNTIPFTFLISSSSLPNSRPQIIAVPEVFPNIVQSMLIVVDLPAPFSPRNANISPSSTSKEIPSTAVCSLYFFVRSLTSMIFMLFPPVRPQYAIFRHAERATLPSCIKGLPSCGVRPHQADLTGSDPIVTLRPLSRQAPC